MEMFHSSFLIKFICSADSDGQKTVQIVGVYLMGLFEGEDGVLVLIVLLVKTA